MSHVAIVAGTRVVISKDEREIYPGSSRGVEEPRTSFATKSSNLIRCQQFLFQNSRTISKSQTLINDTILCQ